MRWHRREGSRMQSLRYGALSVIGAISILTLAQSASGQAGDHERLIGAWRLAHIDSTGMEEKQTGTQPQGILIYTRDGHVSVQLMYPKSANVQSNEYVTNGYEASFGSYDMDEARHLLTHHVQGSITRDLLVGKDLTRVYQFTHDGKLIIRPAGLDEHWSVTWEHY
jgi:hypothetical protein